MHTIVIIPAAKQAAANALAAQAFDTDGGGELTFTVGLVTPPDMETVTHYWCAASFSASKRAMLLGLIAQLEWADVIVADYDPATDPEFPQQLLATNNLAPAPVNLFPN